MDYVPAGVIRPGLIVRRWCQPVVELRARIPKYIAFKPSTVSTAPAITFDHTMPPCGETPYRIHGETMNQMPNTGSVQVMPWLRSNAIPNANANATHTIPTTKSLTASALVSWNPMIDGDRAAYTAVSNVRPNVPCAVIDSAARP